MRLCWLLLAALEVANSLEPIDKNPLSHPGALRYNRIDEERAGVASCPPVRLEHGRVRMRSRARLARYVCFVGYELVGNKYATCNGRTWDVPPPVCIRGGCDPLPPVQNGIGLLSHRGAYVVFFCFPGYQLSGSLALYCNGQRWNSSVPICVERGAPPPLSCDFDTDWCGWRNDEYHDFDWRRHAGATPSSFLSTGPKADHTRGQQHARDGFYLYVESTGRKENDTARIFSPVYSADLGAKCFSFFYHMFGKSTGSLRVYQKPVSVTLSELLAPDSPLRLWEISGNQGDAWYEGVAMLQPSSEDFQVVVEGVRGASYTSDMALDDVALLTDLDSCVEVTRRVAADQGQRARALNSSFGLDSCAGRCLISNVFSEGGELYTCACDEQCLVLDSCCADFRDLCEFSDETTAPNTDSAIGDFTPILSVTDPDSDLRPQTMRLIGSSPEHSSPITTTTTTRTTETTKPSTPSTLKAKDVVSVRTTPVVFSTARVKTTLPTTTFTPTTVKTTSPSSRTQTTTKKWVSSKNTSSSSLHPQPTASPKPSTAPTSTATPKLPTFPKTSTPKATISPKTSTPSPATATQAIITNKPAPTHTTAAQIETKKPTYSPLEHAREPPQSGSGGGWQVWVWVCVSCVCVCAAAAAAWRVTRRRRAVCADEVRYLTSHDELEVDSQQ